MPGGLAVGIVLFSTILTRNRAGLLASLICLVSTWPALPVPAAYLILILGRLLLGLGESLTVSAW